jgi:plastocyanin
VNRPLLAVLVAVALGAGTFGCGGDDDKGGTATNGGTTTGGEETTPGEETTTGEKPKNGGKTVELSSTTVKVDAVDVALQPANPRVKPGTVTFQIKNKGTLLHAVEVKTPGGEKRSRDISPGKSDTLRVKLDTPGRYTWYCPIDQHRKIGMKGKIRVRGGT